MEERGISQFDSSLKTPSRAKVSDCSLPCLRFLVALLGMWSLYQMPRERAESPHTSPGAVPEQQSSDWWCSSNYRPWNNGPKSLGFALLNRSILSCIKLLP